MATRVTVVDGTTLTGIHGPNNSINVVLRSGLVFPVGIYHPCGAYNVVLVTELTSVQHPSGAYNALDQGGGYFSFGLFSGSNLPAGQTLNNAIFLNAQLVTLNNQPITRA